MPSSVIISLRGPIGCGKTTASEYLVEKHGFTRVSFAAPLKDIAARITPDGRIDKARDRALLQFLGTEYFRSIDPDYWVNLWSDAVSKVSGPVVVDDCRFPNERKAINLLGGYEVYIHTPQEDAAARVLRRDGSQTVGLVGHASEAMNNPEDPAIDYNLYNHGSPGFLYSQLDFLYAGLRK